MDQHLKLTSENRAALARLMARLHELGRTPTQQPYYSYHRPYRSIVFDKDGARVLNDAVKLVQTVPSWKEAYPVDAIQKRIIDAMFELESTDEQLERIIAGLIADCKAIRAFVPYFGFHLEPGIEIKFGNYVLAMLGTEGIETEIIGRLREHIDAAQFTEQEREKELDQYRQYLVKHQNIPILVVNYFGSIEGAKEFVQPIAEQVALFMQFCIGALTDQFFEHPIIIDYRGRFTGDYAALMPVKTVEFDRLTFPDLRGNPWGANITKDDVEKLEALGLLDLTDEFLMPSGSNNDMCNLLVRSMCSFADGERAVSHLSRITAYVTAAEVFFSKKGFATQTVTTGLAAANSKNSTEFEQQLDLARFIYKQRSDAVHSGFEPTATFQARKLSRGAILTMLSMRHELTNRKKIQEWLAGYLSDDTAECPRCGSELAPE